MPHWIAAVGDVSDVTSSQRKRQLIALCSQTLLIYTDQVCKTIKNVEWLLEDSGKNVKH